MELKLCHLYPDALNLYGDRGNMICMENRLRWRGIDLSVCEKPIGRQIKLAEYDLFFIGGGQDFEQQILLEDLRAGTGAEIKAAIRDGKTFLAICGGYQMLGNSYKTWDGKTFDFIGAIDYETLGAKERMIGNFAFRCAEESGGTWDGTVKNLRAGWSSVYCFRDGSPASARLADMGATLIDTQQLTEIGHLQEFQIKMEETL